MKSIQSTHSSPSFDLAINPLEGRWGIRSLDGTLRIDDVSSSCVWKDTQGHHHISLFYNPDSIETIGSDDPDIPASSGVRLKSSHHGSVAFNTEILLADRDPICFMRVDIRNNSEESIYLERVNFLTDEAIHEKKGKETSDSKQPLVHAAQEQLRFFGQGWQSWSYAGILGPDQSFPRSKLGPLSAPMQLCWGQKHPVGKGKFISDFYGALVDSESGRGLLIGFLSQMQAFGRVEVDLNRKRTLRALWQNLESVRLPSGGSFITDWACIYTFNIDQPEPLNPYLQLVASMHTVGQISEAISGWCSWYYYGQKISPTSLRQQLDWLDHNRDKLKFKLFQIDDGYQQNIGDWGQDEERFSRPIEEMSAEIHAASLDAGIWMAPLIARKNSQLATMNPEWLLKNSRGKPINAGFGWGGFFYALDGTHPGLRTAIREWVTRASYEWQFDYLKLDFLYAGSLLGERYDDTKTGAMVLRQALTDIRTTVGKDTFLVGCGCPLASGIGLVDSMRVSPDVSEHWRGRYKGVSVLVKRDPGFPAAWNAIRNSFFRAHQHGHWWMNDPDCILLREDPSSLSENEVRTLATIVALCGGVIVDSDKISDLSDERVAMLARLLPPLNRRPVQPTLFEPDQPQIAMHHLRGAIGNWLLAAFFNFDEKAKQVSVRSDLLEFQPNETVMGFEFWDQGFDNFSGDCWNVGVIPAHGVKLWAFRRLETGIQWMGDMIHVSQGSCVVGWEAEKKTLHATINSGRVGKEKLWLKVPGQLQVASIDGVMVEDFSPGAGIVEFEIQLDHHNDFFIQWD